jgi:hypothetical protein
MNKIVWRGSPKDVKKHRYLLQVLFSGGWRNKGSYRTKLFARDNAELYVELGHEARVVDTRAKFSSGEFLTDEALEY